MKSEIKDKEMYLEGCVYQGSHTAEKRAYWVYRKYYQKECNAWAITIDPAGTPITIFKGLADLPHSYSANVDENIADKLATSIKRKAEEHPEQLPAKLLLTEHQDLPDEVLSQLPSQPALVRAIQKIYQKKVLPIPTKLWYLKERPDRYKKTLLDE